MGQAKLKGRNKQERVAAILAAHSVKVLTPERYNAFVASDARGHRLPNRWVARFLSTQLGDFFLYAENAVWQGPSDIMFPDMKNRPALTA